VATVIRLPTDVPAPAFTPAADRVRDHRPRATWRRTALHVRDCGAEPRMSPSPRTVHSREGP
jgi:ribosomal protein L39E